MLNFKDVVIIDDNANDLLGISKAFSSEGSSVICIKYDDASIIEKCKKAAETNFKIIVTDIQMLENNNVGDVDVEAQAKMIVSLFDKLLKQRRLYLLLVWTTKEEAYDEFIEIINKRLKQLGKSLPLASFPIYKNKCKDKNDEYCAEKILESVEKFLDEHKQFAALVAWENNCSKAIVQTIEETYLLQDNVKNTLEALGTKVAGKHFKELKGSALNEALQYILRDKMGAIENACEYKKFVEEAVNDVVKDENIDKSLMCKLNTLLHFDFSHSFSNEHIAPGEFIKLSAEKVFNFCTMKNFSEFNREITNAEVQKRIREIIYTFYKVDQDSKKNIKDHLQNYEIGLIEISPGCDYANNKKTIQNFAVAISANQELKTNLLNSNSGIFCLDYYSNNECKFLAVNARMILGIKEDFLLSVHSSDVNFRLFRIRENMLIHIIRNISNFNSRVGTVSFDVK